MIISTLERMIEVFLDTSYVIALVNTKDRYHRNAITIAKQFEHDNVKLVTTWAVLLEVGNALSRQSFRAASVQLIQAMKADPKVEIVALSSALCDSAWHLYQKRMDKEWGLVDCISFCVMHNRQIEKAATADQHFRQAGFQALLLETE